MKFRWFLLLILILITISHISAEDTEGWGEVTVNKVTFKLPEKYLNGTSFDNFNTGYSKGEKQFFHLNSLIKYESLKSVYGITSTSRGIIDIEECNIEDHDAVVIYNYNDLYDYDYLDVFFTTGKKIFRIQYPASNVTDELKEIINSTPKSNMSKEVFFNKLDTAQRDYIEEENQKNLELDLEDFYRNYNDNRREHFSYVSWGSNGPTFGGGISW